MTLLDLLNKLGIGGSEITLKQPESSPPTNPISEVIKPQENSSINEPKPESKVEEQQQENSSANEQQKIDDLLKEVTELKAANQQLLLGTVAQKQPTIEESILDLAGLGGLLNGDN